MEEAVRDHNRKLRHLLDRCRAKSIKLNEEKIELKKTSIPYIRHILTSEGVKADPLKIEAILKMDRPDDIAGIRRIMGTVNYIAKLLPRLSEVSEPLRQLIKKDSKFAWNSTHDDAFEEIKKLVTEPPILKYYETTNRWYCNARQATTQATQAMGIMINWGKSHFCHY